jgi:glycosyltransferase involved in cell wall biosynthesis
MRPKISVILPVYNRSWCVGRAIDSVLAQTFRDFELIVVDDGSTDDTPAVLASYGTRITVLTQPNAGAYAARNLALRHSNAELVAFMDSDDFWLPDRLERQLPLLERPEVALVFGDATVIGTRRSTFWITPPKRGRVASHFAWGNFVATCTVLVRREALGEFSESAPLSADYLAWFRIALQHELDYVDDGPVAEYRIHADGISFDLARALETRIQLFSEELERTTDVRARALLRRILFNLALHLGVASLRRRAHHFQLAWHTARKAATFAVGSWLAAFAMHHAMARGRRLFS